jgi:hypothetical protein
MSSSASTSKSVDTAKKAVEDKPKQTANPHLGVLEEDDEFEEFPVAGKWTTCYTVA